MAPNLAPAFTTVPAAGSSTKITSPSCDCALSGMPTGARPSSRSTHSWVAVNRYAERSAMLTLPWCAGEVALGQLHGPAQAAAVWIGCIIHVLPVQAQPSLQPQRVTRTETARQHSKLPTRCEQHVPHAARGIRVDVELEPVLARVSRA